ncbi:hypothetical protein JZ751_025822 [Albula glossodonta]|uniref:CASAMP N-terminal domain-containing protein n=1 Tax=Albula glossodonta TaxID=121402 RepID=A0A8T2NLF4_9TELE|nr:hypothetical protein JZ751_025822 [Albula glossodonta]
MFYLDLYPIKPMQSNPSVWADRAGATGCRLIETVRQENRSERGKTEIEQKDRNHSIPEELKEPFYTDQYSQEHIKPPVVNLLLSAELYCRAGSLILKSDAAKPLLGHDAVIQALAQKGLYVTDQERLVTERDLSKRPIKMVR